MKQDYQPAVNQVNQTVESLNWAPASNYKMFSKPGNTYVIKIQQTYMVWNQKM